jgi:hypothetical protein
MQKIVELGSAKVCRIRERSRHVAKAYGSPIKKRMVEVVKLLRWS